nr:zinc finger, CCHC-type [Tanacetum cinerariifolium]GEZ62794.1 zinc finger, CCHC-type [Tanacetum cinerariifolium]
MQGVEFEVEPQEDHTFEVEPHGNVDHVAGSQEVQTQDLIYYHLARDREQLPKHELFNYREDNNEAAFAVIFKWKAGLKDDMDAPLDVYVLSNGCKKCNDDSDIYYYEEYTPAKGNVLGMKIVRDQSGNTLRVSQSRFYNEKLVQTLLEGHSILSLSSEGSLSGDCDVKNNDVQVFMDFNYTMGRSITAMGRSITRYELMIQGCAGSLEAMMLHMMALSPTETGYMTLTDVVNEAIWINGLLTESRAKLMSAAIFYYWCLEKGDPYFEVLAMVEVAMYCRRLI